MAQADYVSNAIRALITGANAKPSTNPIQAAYAEFVAALAGSAECAATALVSICRYFVF